MIKKMEDKHVEIETQKLKDYRLKQPLLLLDQKKILTALPENLQTKIGLDIYSQLPSTNQYLLDDNDRNYTQPVFCLAEMQTAGKGRMGRQWHSPFGQNIYCSLRWDLPVGVCQLSGLSLVIGLAVLKALQQFDPSLLLELKWPNDIFARGKKLGGILIEMLAKSSGSCSVIIGIGLNCNMLNDDDVIER